MNDRQYEATVHTDGPLLIIAGAGSGKTRVLTHRIAYLIEEEGVNPYNIMAITFTNKAAKEMRERVDRLVGYGSESVWVMTFHSTCVRILRRYIDRIGYDNNFTIYDTDDSKSTMKAVFKKLSIDPKQTKESTVLREISRAKDELLSPDEYEARNSVDFGKRKIINCYREYQNMLRKNNALDFDDIIRLTVYLFKACPDVLESYQERFKYIMVDEYQDTNTAQFMLVKLLARKYENICVVGDDDQSIYKFRGANIMNILNFENEFKGAKVIKLEQNYRSTQNILDAANAVISNNRGRKGKALWTERKDEEPVHFLSFDSGKEEAEAICDEICRMKRKGQYDYKDIAILYRTNAQSREFEERFVHDNVHYKLVGGVNFYSRKEIKDILAYLKTIDNGVDDLQVKRIINVPKRGIGDTTVKKIEDYADMKGISFYNACLEASEIEGLNKAAAKVKLFTDMIEKFKDVLASKGIGGVTENIIDETGYIDEIKSEDDEIKAEERIENIEEFMSKITDFEDENPESGLSEFLEEVALVSDVDSVNDDDNKILMMTIHSAKGLEFPVVYISGMEEGVFPGYLTINTGSDEDMEEERRLAYVAITRAMNRLSLSYAKSRIIRGQVQYNAVSRFVKEIPAELLDGEVPKPKYNFFDDYEEDSAPKRFMKEKPFGFNDDDGFIPRKVTFAPKKEKEVMTQAEALAKLGTMQKGISGGTKPDYEAGDRVRHLKFGDGTVLTVTPGPKDYQVTVEFDNFGKKIMYAAFAKLVKL